VEEKKSFEKASTGALVSPHCILCLIPQPLLRLERERMREKEERERERQNQIGHVNQGDYWFKEFA
jgi:hypothetical protein